jgi:prepilin-type processing-associated H-X9-DG protein
MRRRSGISRIDVLVGLLIVVVGAGLLLPVVQRIRESEAAAKCRNNLKQLAIATKSCESTYQRLPALTDQGAGAPTDRGLPSVFSQLAPFLVANPPIFRPELPPDHYNAHSSVAVSFERPGVAYGSKDGKGTMQGGLANWPWLLFLDPSDGTALGLSDMPMTLPDGTTGYYATGSYAANGLLPWGKKGVGEFPGSLAQTVLFSERPQVCQTAAGETIYNLWGVGFYSPYMPAFATLTPDDPPGLCSTGQIAPATLPDENADDRDALIRVRIGRQNAEPGPPDFPTPVQYLRPGRPCDPRLPGTPHRGGLQAAMADGSVRVFALDTSPWVFWSACMPPKPPTD